MIGRAYLLGAGGQRSGRVENVLDNPAGRQSTAPSWGWATPPSAELGPDDLVVPPGFFRALGTGGPD